MLVKLLSVVAVAASCVFASAISTVTTRHSELNPPVSASASSYHPISQVAARGFTNAKRLALGLPLKPPTRRRTFVPRAQPSGTAPMQGYVVVRDANENTVGYVSKVQDSRGEYVVDPVPKPDDRLIVSLDLNDAVKGTANIQTVNGPDADFPFFGGILGYGNLGFNLGSGSFNYAFLGGTVQTPPNSPPTPGGNTYSASLAGDDDDDDDDDDNLQPIESAIWTLDQTTYKLTPQWINSNGGSPIIYLGAEAGSGKLILTGDTNSYASRFGPANWVSLYFVPIVQAPA